MNERVVQSLKQWTNSKDSSLHQHLSQILTHIPTDSVDPLHHFETISQLFKKIQFHSHQPPTSQQIQIQNEKCIQYPEWILNTENLIHECKKIKQTSDRFVQNFIHQSQMLFEPAGISFGSKESYKINLALQRLADRQNCSSIRFWGKILTTDGDYLIIQGKAKKKKEPIVYEDMQKYLEGANSYSFWVNHETIGENWYELPLITPEQIRVSRLVKHIFSGNLFAAVKSYPKFNGEERHFLKAQLVRITHNCEISPKGLYSPLQENNEEIQFSEEFKMGEFSELSNLQNWVHLNPYILNNGRASYYLNNIPEPEREEILAKLQTEDPKIERLKQINEDKGVQQMGTEGCWLARPEGNLQVFNTKEEGGTTCYGIVTLKNPNWPGWLTVTNTKGYGSIYIGYGYKLTQNCFYPMSPEDLYVEGDDVEEFGEPNPKDPPDELQPDSDDENKKADE